MAQLQAQQTRQSGQQRLASKTRIVRLMYQYGYGREHVLRLFRLIDWMMALSPELEPAFEQAMAEHERLALARRGFRHRRRQSSPGVVGGDRQRGEVRQRAGPLESYMHVGHLVLDRLERTDGHTELMAIPDVLQR